MANESLLELTADFQRLLPAGAATAVGNVTLQRHGRSLRELGRKVAPLSAVADAVERLTTAAPAQAGPVLLDLLLMTRQLRAGLTACGLAGEATALPESGPWQTPAVPQHLYAAADALTTSGSGRESAVKNARSCGVLRDLRLTTPLLDALADKNAGLADHVAGEGLADVGRAVLPELLRKLDLQGKTVDARRLWAICSIDKGTGAKLCRQVLRPAYDKLFPERVAALPAIDASAPLRAQALRCLPDVVEPEEAERIGLALMQDKNRDVRQAAAQALRGASSDEALEQLVRLLTDDATDQEQTAPVLVNLRHPQTTPRLLRELGDRVAGLPPLQQDPKTGRSNEHHAGQRLVVWMIGIISRRGTDQPEAAIAGLLPLARHAYASIRLSALQALIAVAPANRAVLDVLIGLLQETDQRSSMLATELLTQLPPDVREPAIPVLLQMLATSPARQSLRWTALPLLEVHVERYGPALVPMLRSIMKDMGAHSSYRYPAFRLLARIGPAARDAVPEVLEQLERGSPKQGGGVPGQAEVLAGIEPDGATAIPGLIRLLDDPQVAVKSFGRDLMIDSLKAYGPRAAAAIPTLQRLTNDANPDIANRAREALAAIQK